MKLYAFSLAAGLLVGIIYSLIQVRSPAPPLVALVGLLGILVGEQIVPVGKKLMAGAGFGEACVECKATDHVLGQLPGKASSSSTSKPAPTSPAQDS